MNKKYGLKSVILSLLFLFVLAACSEDKKDARFNEYAEYWQNQEYEDMYNMLTTTSKERISKEDFVNRYTTIYNAMSAQDIQIQVQENEEKTDDVEPTKFSIQLNTFLGELTLDDYEVWVVEEEQGDEKDWFIDWDESLIFPQMSGEDELRIETIPAKRGEIFDKEGNPLALNGTRYHLGIHPARFDEANISEVATILDIDEMIIQEKLDQNTNPEYFVPIVKVATEQEELLAELLAIEGVISQEVEGRIYPGGEAFGSLIGYINPITKEELDESEAGVYSSTSLVGKAGVESVFEEELRAKDGKEIYISKIEGGEEIHRISLIKSEAEDGKDLNLTIDSNLQKNIYAEVEGDVGTASAIHPKTGEVLALVSYPSYDSNFYTSYTPNGQKEIWENMEVSVFENRFNKAYSPGSAFKIVTAAIGLENGTIEPEKKLRIEDKGWQKDASWGDYKVNRVSQKLSQLDLEDAFVYSDNIYFAQSALAIGGDTFIKEAKEFGFEEEIPFEYPFANSQITNDGTLEQEILLADTGYGQGEVLMSSLHLSLIYGALVNDGNMMQPTLEKVEENANIWKENLITEENREILLDSLISTIEHPDGTGRIAQIDGVTLAGKTGTAEFKESQEESGKENGWFVALNVDNPEIVLSMMVENVENREGSAYVVERVRNVLEDYFMQ